ncbi:MAG: glycosyltransferase family 2 protein [Litorimonas sp.]
MNTPSYTMSALENAAKDPSISVIIPTYKDDRTLAALLQNLHDMDVTEIIIADGEARPELPPNLRAQVSQSLQAKTTWIAAAPKGRGSQIHTGINYARSDYIWILHADSRLGKTAPNAIRSLLANTRHSLGTFTLKFDSPDRALSLFAWVSRIDCRLTTFGDQGFFFRRKDYIKLGLDLTPYPLLEDVALRSALKTIGRIKRARVPIVTSARRFKRQGIWATQIFNARILWRYMRGDNPTALYQDYYHPSPQVANTQRPSLPI